MGVDRKGRYLGGGRGRQDQAMIHREPPPNKPGHRQIAHERTLKTPGTDDIDLRMMNE
jgi:hypothetical protein